MHIDWFTVVAQIINFLILVWLMKHFLYKPVLNAIDAREKLIAAKLADADARKAEALSERDEFQQKQAEFDRQHDAMLQLATDEVNNERKRLLEAARIAADELQTKREEALRNEINILNQTISRRTQQEVFAIARKTLTDLSSSSLEASLVEAFIKRIKGMQGKEKAELSDFLLLSKEPIIVRSAFDLQDSQHAEIQNTIQETFSSALPIRFETEPGLISGIEMIANGYKIAWNIEDYLLALETGVEELLKDKKIEIPKPEPVHE